MLVAGISYVRLERFGIDWIPPTMGATYDHLKVVWIDVHCVLDTIVTYDIAECFFDRGCNSVFTCIHVSDVRVSKALGKFLPCLMRDVVGFSNVDAPDATCGRLEYAKQMHHLVVEHGIVEVLWVYARDGMRWR